MSTLQNNEETERLEVGCLIKHFKHELNTEEQNSRNHHIYRFIAIAKHTETGEKLAIYRSSETGDVYASPYDMFIGEVDHEKYPDIKQKYRLEKLSDGEIRIYLRRWMTRQMEKSNNTDTATI